MKLKNIEIKGFKSFGDKVALHFTDGVTGIVGPNGCGKSNVVDALRWVLGEQKTRMLRSEKMENVIFNGTKKRRQSSVAEVHVCFENTSGLLPVEYREVTISRRLYRTGESEYMLNGIGCRLRDISTLLMNTGVGSDSYAIMELRMIEDILSDKDNSRRLILEEAAGISRYKARKKESLTKLQETEQDLSRVDDLVHEIEKNMKALQVQARRAEKYARMKEDYRQQALRLAATQMCALQTELDSHATESRRFSDEQAALDARIATAEAGVQEYKNRLLQQEQALRTLQAQARAFLDETRSLEQAKQLGGERLQSLRQQEQLISERLSNDQAALEELTQAQEQHWSHIQTTESEVGQRLQEKTTRANELNEKQTELDRLGVALQQKTRELQALVARIHAHERQQSVEAGRQESARQELDRIAKETRQADADQMQVIERLGENERQKAGVLERIESLKQAVKEGEDKKAAFITQRDTLRADLDGLLRETDKLRNEQQLTRSMVEGMEGYPESHKYLREHGQFSGPPAVVADLLQTDPEWKPILEAFLEPFLHYYLVHTAEEAKQAVMLLSEAARGRVGFFVLESFPRAGKKEPPLPAGCTTAYSIIRCHAEHAPLFRHLLQGVLICEEDSISPLIEPVLGGQSPYVLLGKSGVISIGKSWISGGSIGLFQGKRIGRALRIEELAREIEKNELEISQRKAFIAGLDEEIRQVGREIEAIPLSELQRTSTELDAAGNQIGQQRALVEAILTRNQRRMGELEGYLNKGENGGETENQDVEILKAQRDHIQQEIDELQPAAEGLRLEVDPLRRQFHEAGLAWQQAVGRLESHRQSLNQGQQQIRRLEDRMLQDKAQLQQVRGEAEKWQEQQGPGDEELSERYGRQAELNTGLGQAEEDFLEERNKLSRLEEEIREYRLRRDQGVQLQQASLNRLNELRVREISIRERLRVEFDLELEALQDAEPVAPGELSAMEQRTADLRSRLSEFGAVNPMALETYKEVEERNVFITRQRADLLNARSSLLETIEEIDQTARERFLEAFAQIRTYFIEVFRTLFSDEDACDLQLVDPEQPLDSQVHIVARPKGKKPLSINQLSGGEKSLTATALLFAIFLFKPAPFCIFDEVDAPLDDNNIDKFNRMIRQFSRQSQFVIVTHNKKTMETTDVMYGITMVEQGVSRVVPVDFRSL